MEKESIYRNKDRVKVMDITAVSNNCARKLSCRKDDRAMRPIYECPENFRESLTMSTATFPENVSRACLPTDTMN